MRSAWRPGASLPAGKRYAPFASLTTVTVIGEPARCALTSTPSIAPSSFEVTVPESDCAEAAPKFSSEAITRNDALLMAGLLSIRADVGVAHDLLVAHALVVDELRELRRVPGRDLAADVRDALLHVIGRKRLLDGRVDLVHDRPRRLRRRDDSIPHARLESRIARLGDRRRSGKHRGARRAHERERAKLPRLGVRRDFERVDGDERQLPSE